jgi:hypothetical protein
MRLAGAHGVFTMSVDRSRFSVVSYSGVVAVVLTIGALAILGKPEAQVQRRPQSSADNDPALERTREQVRMLDDLYKNAVVSITTRYVGARSAQPAIKVAQDIFGAMEKQGWHSVKLVDATGDPMNDDNAPQSAFEKDAARAMNSGKRYFERVVGNGKERRLLAATVVPVVMQKCTVCHSDKKMGDVLGFLRYDVPIK